MTLNMAIAMVKSAGYRVTKSRPKTRRVRPALNALGKPLSPLFDPNYKMKTPLTSIARLRGPQNFPWVSVPEKK
jgi:hypothetical protein